MAKEWSGVKPIPPTRQQGDESALSRKANPTLHECFAMCPILTLAALQGAGLTGSRRHRGAAAGGFCFQQGKSFVVLPDIDCFFPK